MLIPLADGLPIEMRDSGSWILLVVLGLGMLLATLLLFLGGRALIDRSVQLRVGERGLSWKTGVFGRSPRLMEWRDILSDRIERGYRVRNLVVDLYDGRDRQSVVCGKSVSVRIDLGGRRIIKQKNV